MRIFCSICKDIYLPFSEVHVTKCGHLYHASCISTWIKQHRTCPQCRAKTSQPFRVYFDVEKDTEADPSTLEHELETLSDKLRETEREKKILQDECNTVTSIVESMKDCAMGLTRKNEALRTSVKALKTQVTNLTKQNEIICQLEGEVEKWKGKAQTFERVEILINGTVEEANRMIEVTPVTELSVRQLCTYVSMLKSQLQQLEMRNIKLSKLNKELTKSLTQKLANESSDPVEMERLKEHNRRLENELQTLRVSFENYAKKQQNKKEDRVLSQVDNTQTKSKRTLIDLDMDFDDLIETKTECVNNVKEDKFKQWEKMVCAGPSVSLSLSLQKSKSFSRFVSTDADNQQVQRSEAAYAFDGFGGRKRIRLGGPTPREEFEQIKKKKEKKTTPNFQHKKILDYYQVQMN